MLNEKKYPRCATCLHRMKHKLWPDTCTWAWEDCKDVTDSECWYGDKMENVTG